MGKVNTGWSSMRASEIVYSLVFDSEMINFAEKLGMAGNVMTCTFDNTDDFKIIGDIVYDSTRKLVGRAIDSTSDSYILLPFITTDIEATHIAVMYEKSTNPNIDIQIVKSIGTQNNSVLEDMYFPQNIPRTWETYNKSALTPIHEFTTTSKENIGSYGDTVSDFTPKTFECFGIRVKFLTPGTMLKGIGFCFK